jgi:hypothetical protein
MLLSRFWYLVVALVLGAAIYVLNLASGMYNRAGARAMGEALNSDSQVVAWYLRGDARQRSAHLIKFAVDPDISRSLDKSSRDEKQIPEEARDKVKAALRKVAEEIPKEERFDAVFAIDQLGRVVAHVGYEQASNTPGFELGGYPVVADALHGNVRDDTLVLDRVYRVVARPVELDFNGAPAGAILGARIIDDRFARELSSRTGAAVAFFSRGQRVASGAPEGFVTAQLDEVVRDLDNLAQDKDFVEKGRSAVRVLGARLGVQYSLLPGETWQLGSGYAVARLPSAVDSPAGFFSQADDTDKEQGKPLVAGAVALAAALIGLLLSFFEHTLPLRTFRKEAQLMAEGKNDALAPSKFRGIYRKIASELNDGIDQVAAKGGAPRRATDLKEVLGDIPDQPVMSAFSFPGETATSPGMAPAAPVPSRPLPSVGGRAPVPSAPGAAPAPSAAGPGRRPPPPRRGPEPVVEASDEPSEWQKVYEDFVALKQQCGESVDGFTYEKFEQTLIKNKEALISRHGATRVKFSVYIKEGKAALKASPQRD